MKLKTEQMKLEIESLSQLREKRHERLIIDALRN